MKQWLIVTKSESGDDYNYFINHLKQPTFKELRKFLREHAYDKDEEKVYENVESVIEIKGFLDIPRN